MSRGFTLLELLVYVAIFALVSGMFIGILLITLRVQGTQTGLVEISNQLSFAMQTIQRNIREATTVTAPAVGATASTLSLNGGATVISLGTCGGVTDAICINSTPITTDKIAVTGLSFTHSFTPSAVQPPPPGAGDTHTINVSITANNKSANPAQYTERTLQSSASPLNQ